MTYLFAATNAEEAIPAGHLQQVIQSYSEHPFTGIVEIGNVGGGYLDFLFHLGRIVTLHARNPAGLIPISIEHWGQIISARSKSQHPLGSLRLSPHTIHLARIRLAQANQGQHFLNLPTVMLFENVNLWRERSEPALLHIRWLSADALIYFSGQKHEAEPLVMLSCGQEMPGKTAVVDLAAWTEPEYSVAILSRVSNDAWSLYSLREASARLLQNLFVRYGEVTGRVLVNSVIRSLNVACASKNLDINVLNGEVIDRAVFARLVEASSAYRELISFTLQQMGVLVGRNVVQLILDDVLTGMDGFCLQTIESAYLIPDAILPIDNRRSLP